MALPEGIINQLSQAVHLNATQRRGVEEDLMNDVCDAFCPPCVRNALGSLSACYSVASPGGSCWGCGTPTPPHCNPSATVNPSPTAL